MSLIDKIEKLQKKPEHFRYKVLVFTLIVLMAVVVFIWVSLMSVSIKNVQINSDNSEAVLPDGVFDNLKNDSKSVLNVIKEDISGFKKNIKSIFGNFGNDQYKYESGE